MTVLETIRKYGLEDYEKKYTNQYGNRVDTAFPLQDLIYKEVKSLYIHFPTNSCEIVVIEVIGNDD